MTEWRPIDSGPYEVSDCGLVRRGKRVLKPKIQRAPSRIRVLAFGAIAIAVSACGNNAPAKSPERATNCDPDGVISFRENRWRVATFEKNRDEEINSGEYERLADDVRCLPEVHPFAQKLIADGRITHAERDELEKRLADARWARMERVINADQAKARAKFRAASGMSAGTAETPKSGSGALARQPDP